MDLLIFLAILSALILVHELGHFLAARLFGVRVLTLSLGVGPTLARIRGPETEYRLGLFPMGGYVRLLERARGAPPSQSEDRRTFEAASFGKRAVIVLAGPSMNLLFALLLYFSVFLQTDSFLPPTVGAVLPGYPAEGVLMPGDRVMAVDGHEVATFEELQRLVRERPAEPLTLTVFRGNAHVEVTVTPRSTDPRDELGLDGRVGTLGIQHTPPAGVIGVPDSGSPAARDGLRTLDVITHIDGKPVPRLGDLLAALASNRGETVPVTYLRLRPVEGALGGYAALAVYEVGVAALTPRPGSGTVAERVGIEPADAYIAVVLPGGPLAKAGVLPGDKLLRVDDEPVAAWAVLAERLRRYPGGTLRVVVARAGVEVSTEVAVPPASSSDADAESLAARLGGGPWLPLALEPRVEHPAPTRYAAAQALRETLRVVRFLATSVGRLVSGRLGTENLAGPLTLYEVAGLEREKGADYLIWLIAFISINLGLLNLLPIPGLDGGQLLFMALEKLMRRPLPARARAVAQAVGIGLLVLLMGVALKNDVRRLLGGDARPREPAFKSSVSAEP